MSASEPVAVPVEDVKVPDTAPVVDTPAEPKVEEPATVSDVVVPAVEAEATPATEVEATAAEEPSKDETKPVDEPKDSVPKSPNFLTKLLSSLKVDKSKVEKKVKAPKSPKKEKKKEEVEVPAVEETPKEVPVVEASEPAKEEVTEAVKETEVAPVVQATEEVKEVKEETPTVQKEEKKALKVGRRLSARVGDFFKSKPKQEVTPPAKVDEHPPKIDEPVKVAPLENPATDAPESKVEESAKPMVDAAAPVVAATA